MKKFRIVDFIILLAVAAALVVGFLTYKHFRQTASKQIESTSKIAFQVFLRGVTITGGISPIKPGDDTFISIRNVPYTNLKIVDVKIDTKKVVVPDITGKRPYILVDDYSQIFMYDVVVTVIDTATITKDGAVVGGNKIKIGMPITLEGKNYKFNGSVSNVQILKDDTQNNKVNTMAPAQGGTMPQANAPAQTNAPAQPQVEQGQPQTEPQAKTQQPEAPVSTVAPAAKTEPNNQLKK